MEILGHQKLGDRYDAPAFPLEDRGVHELPTWGGAFPGLEPWHDVL